MKTVSSCPTSWNAYFVSPRRPKGRTKVPEGRQMRIGQAGTEMFAKKKRPTFENFFKIIEISRFRWMLNVFGPSRSPPCFFGCLLGHPLAVRFRLMFHTVGLLGKFVLHGICISNKRRTSWFRIQYYTFATFCSVWGLALCLLFAVASNGEVSFSMTVSRFRCVRHRLWRFTFF